MVLITGSKKLMEARVPKSKIVGGKVRAKLPRASVEKAVKQLAQEAGELVPNEPKQVRVPEVQDTRSLFFKEEFIKERKRFSAL